MGGEEGSHCDGKSQLVIMGHPGKKTPGTAPQRYQENVGGQGLQMRPMVSEKEKIISTHSVPSFQKIDQGLILVK